MELKIIYSDENFNEICRYIERHLQSKIRVEQLELSMFEQYRLYPGEKKFIPKLWSYRIVAKNGKFHFGTI